MGIISYGLRCSETEQFDYNQFRSSTTSTTAIQRSSGTTSEAKKCKVQLKSPIQLIISMFKGVIKPNIPITISLGHSQPLLQQFRRHLGQPPRPKMQSSTKRSIWFSISMFKVFFKTNIPVTIILVHPRPLLQPF